jgi:hypothetical protein
VLFDQPHVVAAAGALLGEEGVADRCRIEAGSFFEAVPDGGDAYVLKMIVHDWEAGLAGASGWAPGSIGAVDRPAAHGQGLAAL